MNDDQRERLLTVLGDAFDKAATTCSHKRQAAMRIIHALAEAGFKIEPRRSK